jgi:hypothetical protein
MIMKCSHCDTSIEMEPGDEFPAGWNYHHSSLEHFGHPSGRGDLLLCPTCSPKRDYAIGTRRTPYID